MLFAFWEVTLLTPWALGGRKCSSYLSQTDDFHATLHETYMGAIIVTRIWSNGSLWFLSGSLWFPLVPSGSLWFSLVPFGSLWFPLVPSASPLVPLWFPLLPSGSSGEVMGK